MKDREIHGESSVWSIAQRLINIYRFDVDVGFERHYGSVSIRCSLVFSCVQERR